MTAARAVTMWDFSWLLRRFGDEAEYAEVDKVLDELAERGYDVVRIDAFPHWIAETVITKRPAPAAARWNLQRLNELEVCLGGGTEYGYSTVYASPGHGDFARFQPGGGIGMGFDDLKTIEAAEQSAAVGGWVAVEPAAQPAT